MKTTNCFCWPLSQSNISIRFLQATYFFRCISWLYLFQHYCSICGVHVIQHAEICWTISFIKFKYLMNGHSCNIYIVAPLPIKHPIVYAIPQRWDGMASLLLSQRNISIRRLRATYFFHCFSCLYFFEHYGSICGIHVIQHAELCWTISFIKSKYLMKGHSCNIHIVAPLPTSTQ